MSKNSSRKYNTFNFHALSHPHKSLLAIYLPFIPSDFHYLFNQFHLYNDIPYVHAFIFSVWQCSQLMLFPPSIAITPQIAALPFHSLLFHITHPSL
jgi:hypothetical protein